MVFAIVMSALPARAQTSHTIDADLSFAFAVGNKTYEPGAYKLRVQPIASGSAFVTVVDKDGKPLQTVIGSLTGNRSTRKPALVFGRRGELRVLTGIALPGRGLIIGGTGGR
ncbi:MAG: hypothetical protein ACK4S4_07875 [Pyrinomonadaceae bacterium]